MNITEFRQKYPEYNKVDDAKLTEALHKKHYSHVPFGDFKNKFNPDKTAWSDVGLQAVKNIPSSGKQFAKDIVQPFLHPVETGKAIYGLGSGVVQKFVPGEQEDEKMVDAVVDMFKDRYGSVEGVKKTIATDPVGVVADAASVLTGVGGVVRGSATIAPKLSKVGKAGKVLQDVGGAIDPTNIIFKQPVRGVMAATSPFAKKLYMSGLKPSTTITPQERIKLFETAVKNNTNISVKSKNEALNLLKEYRETVDEIIKSGAERGEYVSRDRLIKALENKFDEYETRSSLPEGSQRAILNAMEEVERTLPEDIPVDLAQQKKVGTQKEIAEKRKAFARELTPKDEAKKAVARSLREQLEEKYPELRRLNELQGEILELDKALEKALPRVENWNIFGLTPAVVGGGVATISPELAIPAAITAKALEHPTVKSRLALSLIKARGRDQNVMKGSLPRLGIYQATKGSEKKSEQYLNNAKYSGFATRTVRDKNGKIKSIEVK